MSLAQCFADFNLFGTGLPYTFEPPSTFLTLMFLLSVEGVLTALEDRKRHVADDIANSRDTLIWSNADKVFRVVPWSKVKVGDLCFVNNGDTFPADLLLCFTSGAGNTDCKVETKSLDGETNLKLRSAHKKFAENSMIKVVEEKKSKGFNACVRPSSVDMYRFSNNKYCEAKVMFDDPRDSMASTSIDTFSGSITLGISPPKMRRKGSKTMARA